MKIKRNTILLFIIFVTSFSTHAQTVKQDQSSNLEVKSYDELRFIFNEKKYIGASDEDSIRVILNLDNISLEKNQIKIKNQEKEEGF